MEINGAQWIFVCPTCKHHTRVVIIMPRLGPSAYCVACNVQMIEVGRHDDSEEAPTNG